jgi:hypothetical protein
VATSSHETKNPNACRDNEASFLVSTSLHLFALLHHQLSLHQPHVPTRICVLMTFINWLNLFHSNIYLYLTPFELTEAWFQLATE